MRSLKEVSGKKVCLYAAAAFLMAVGRAGSLKFYDGARIALQGRMEALIFLVRTVLYSALFLGLFVGIDRLLCSKKIIGSLFESGEKETGKTWTPYLVLGAAWLPLLLIKYPAAVCWDTLEMAAQYRAGSFSEHHSVYYALIMGRLIDIGETFGHADWGMFAFSVIHYLVLVAALGRSVNILRKMGVRRTVRGAVLLMYLLNPYISGYIGVIIKDELYTAFLVIFFLCLVDLQPDHEAFSRNPLKLTILFVSVVNIWLIRKNGSYILLASAVLFLVRCFRKKLSKRPVFVLAAALVVSAGLYSFLGAYFHAEKGSVGEALSLPFQQTARYVKSYENEVTEEERAAIDAVLPYDRLADAYDPRVADPVKGMYRGDGSKLGAYFKTWLAQFRKHPLCYVSATWEQNYYLFVPEEDNITLYTDMNLAPYGDSFKPLAEIFEQTDSGTLKQWIVKEFKAIHQMPLAGLPGNVSFWFYVLLFATVISVAHRTDDFLLLAVSWFTVLFVILGPVIQGHPRYMFPVVYVMPVTVGFIFKERMRHEVFS